MAEKRFQNMTCNSRRLLFESVPGKLGESVQPAFLVSHETVFQEEREMPRPTHRQNHVRYANPPVSAPRSRHIYACIPLPYILIARLTKALTLMVWGQSVRSLPLRQKGDVERTFASYFGTFNPE